MLLTTRPKMSQWSVQEEPEEEVQEALHLCRTKFKSTLCFQCLNTTIPSLPIWWQWHYHQPAEKTKHKKKTQKTNKKKKNGKSKEVAVSCWCVWVYLIKTKATKPIRTPLATELCWYFSTFNNSNPWRDLYKGAVYIKEVKSGLANTSKCKWPAKIGLGKNSSC